MVNKRCVVHYKHYLDGHYEIAADVHKYLQLLYKCFIKPFIVC